MARTELVRDTALRYLTGLTGIAVVAHMLVAVFGNGRDAGGVDVAFTALGGLVGLVTVAWLNADTSFNLRAAISSAKLRIIPAFIATLVTVAIAARILLPRSWWPGIAQDSLMSLLGVQNFHEMFRLSDAGPAGAPTSPLAHLWAVAVIAQIGLVWLLLTCLLRALNRRAGASAHAVVLFAAGTLVVISGIAAAIMVLENQEMAYLASAARAWQFGLGAIAAVLLLRRRTEPRRVGLNVLGWSGIVLIAATAYVMDGSGRAPGPWSLAITVGVMMIVLSTRPKPAVDPVAEALGKSKVVKGWSVGRLLDSLPGRHLGRHAWELFLIFWPVYVFFLAMTNKQLANPVEGLHVVAVAYVLAGLIRFIATRGIRVWREYRPRASLLSVVAGFVIFVVASGVMVEKLDRANEDRIQTLLADAGDYPGALTRHVVDGEWTEGDQPSPTDPATDWYSSEDWRCDHLTGGSANGPDLTMCQVTPQHRGGPRVVVTGGADVLQWIAPIEAIADDHGWDLLVIGADDCQFTDGTHTPEATPECDAWANGALYAVDVITPELVITAGDFLLSDDGHHSPAPGQLSYWQELHGAGLKVAVLATPSQGAQRGQLDESAYARLPVDTQLIDMQPLLCGAAGCRDVIGNVNVYRDDHTVTRTFADTARYDLELLLGERFPGLMNSFG